MAARRSSLRSCPAALLAAAALLPLSGCGDGPTGTGGQRPGLNIVAGAGITDTIDAAPAQALRVVVRDDGGKPVRGVVVRFTSTFVPVPGGGRWPNVFVGGLATTQMGTFAVDTTAGDGSASVRIQLGIMIGPAGVVVTVPEIGLVDTATFTVRPGAPAAVVFATPDTAIAAGGSVALAASVVDRVGNPRAETVTYRLDQGGATLAAGGVVSAAAPTHASIIASTAGLSKTDTAWVSVVPRGTVAVMKGSKLVVMQLDGGDASTIPLSLEVVEPSPEWSTDGQTLFAVLGNFNTPNVLFRVGLSGTTTAVASNSGADGAAVVRGVIRSYAPAPDGASLYVSGNECNLDAVLFRVPLSGDVTPERLSPAVGDPYGDCFDTVHLWPSPSPDGSRFVYEHDASYYSDFSLRVFDLATRTITPLNVAGRRPRWSPAGDLIAYFADNRIWVVKPDGTGKRAVSPAGRLYVAGATWSPDGEWLLARFQPVEWNTSTTVALLNVRTGEEIPLPYTATYPQYGLPVWRPGN